MSSAPALVRKSARVLTAFANATVPVMTVVLRKAYGLGYYVMGSQAAQSRHPARLADGGVWRHGARGRGQHHLQGRARRRRRLPKSAPLCTSALTDALKRSNTAIEVAARYHYDDVIDPADTRDILIKTLATLAPRPPRTTRKRLIEPF